MAILLNNPLLSCVSGRIGNIIFRKVGKRTIVAAAPSKSSAASPKQKAQQRRFKSASNFAKKQMKDKHTKAFYKDLAKRDGMSNAYTAAMAEFLRGI